MPETENTCPFLGLDTDPSLRLMQADGRHRCYALPEEAEHAPSREYQKLTCLTGAHPACPRYRAGSDRAVGEGVPAGVSGQLESRRSWMRFALAGVLVVLIFVVGLQLVRTLAMPPVQPVPTPTALVVVETPAVVAAVTSTPAPQAVAEAVPAAKPDPALAQVATVPAPTPAPDEVVLVLTPAPDAVGWVGSTEARGNHFGDSFLHAGVFEGEILHGAMQFNLSRVPRGAPIRYAALTLTGLDDARLDGDMPAAWELRWLAPEINENWRRVSFQEIHNAPVQQAILPVLGPADLTPLASNQFTFSDEQLALLEKAVLDEQTLIALRVDGPQAGGDSVFSWDTGYGPATLDSPPRLQLVVGPAPPTPPPVPTRDYIVVTSTPTPENVLTAAAILETAAALATQVGTATPTPRSMVTATPTPENEATVQAQRLALGLPVVIVPTPTPENEATAAAMALVATAQALTTGTPTPWPTNAVTATPTPTFAVITNTPTAANAATWVAQVAAEGTRAAVEGTATPLPGWIVTATPSLVVVTSTPTPENFATAQWLAAWPTVVALTTGTVTPTPPNLVTPTWTPAPTALPLVVPLTQLTLTPTPTPPGPDPDIIPDFFRNKIVFWSDRLGDPRLFAMDDQCVYQPQGCRDAEAFWITQGYPHRLGWDQEQYAPDGQRRVLVQPNNNRVPQLFVEDFTYNVILGLTELTGMAYDPAWSPTGERIAFASTEPGNDEIYAINPDGSNLQRLTFNSWEWDKHPTWSPDGRQILFYSNRGDGRRQLWIMNADGSDQRNVSNSSSNDWDPVWIK